jgi:hypothetical protein
MPVRRQRAKTSVTPRVNLFRWDVASLLSKGIINSGHTRVFFCSGQEEEASVWLRQNRKHFTKEIVGLSLTWVEHYYAGDHPPSHQTRNPAVFGVDTITLASKTASFAWHASQCQAQDRWSLPGPYTPANSAVGRRRSKHHNNHKWKLLPELLVLMNRVDLHCVGAISLKNRMMRTFYKKGSKAFKSTFKDLGKLVTLS